MACSPADVRAIRPMGVGATEAAHAQDAMHSTFLTHLDGVPPAARTSGAIRASIRRNVLRDAEAVADGLGDGARSLRDPCLLEGSAIRSVDVSEGRVIIDLVLCKISDDAEGPHPWGGPIRLVAEGQAELACSDPEVRQPDADDPVVWSELRAGSSPPR